MTTTAVTVTKTLSSPTRTNKQELLDRLFWVRTYLLGYDRFNRELGVGPKLKPELKIALISAIWNAWHAYQYADDDEANYDLALSIISSFENSLIAAGINIEAGVALVRQKNGYGPTPGKKKLPEKQVYISTLIPELEDDELADPWL